MFQFGKSVYAEYLVEALYGLAQRSPNFFVREPLHNSSKQGQIHPVS